MKCVLVAAGCLALAMVVTGLYAEGDQTKTEVAPGVTVQKKAPVDANAADTPRAVNAQAHKEPAEFVKPTAEEALAFLRTLPRGWGKRGPKGEVLTWVNPWEARTAEDIKTITTLHPGYHIRNKNDLAQGRVAPEAKALPKFIGKLHIRMDPADYRFFTAFERLEKFEVTHDLEGITDECLFYLGHLAQSVHTIRLEICEAKGDGVKYLANLRNLKTLTMNLSRTLTDVALENAADIASLERLETCGCPEITGSGVSALARLKNLKALKIGSCSLSDASLVNFKDLAIEELDLSHTEMGWAIEFRGGGHAKFTLTYAGLHSFLADKHNLPNLKRLILTSTIQPGLLTPSTLRLSQKEKEELAKLRPGLEVR